MEKLNLTDSDKRDIIKRLEAGKPLPDKFRFLLFADKEEVELVWNGKTGEVNKTVLPFQTIEVVDEPRAENIADTKQQFQHLLIDDRGRQIAGWSNKLIWGDNKLILASLKSGSLRSEIEKAGGLKLIYIDPPFDVGADFSMPVEVGDEDEFTKQPNVLEKFAYDDTWGKGDDSFIAMIYERLSLMKDLLADDGSIYVHCDYRVNSFIRLVMNEIFGEDNFRNEIIWRKGSFFGPSNKLQQFPKNHDTVFYYTKSAVRVFNVTREDYQASTLKQYKYEDKKGKYRLQELRDYTEESIQNFRDEGKIEDTEGGPKLKQYLDDKDGKVVETVWNDINRLSNTIYPTEKPPKLLERIIKASSNEGDLVADFFCGSGTTGAVAEKLGRKWICTDLGKFAIHTTRKRIIGVQRELKENKKDFRAFEILNLGKYERQHYVGVNPNLRDEQQAAQLAQKDANFRELITRAYKAEPVKNFKTFAAQKAGRLVAIGPIDLPVSRLFVEEVIKECVEKQITRVDILSFEFEMGLFPKVQEDAKDKGVDLALKHIPREVFDKRAIEKNQVQFHDVSYIDVKPHVQRAEQGALGSIAVELTDFSVFYNQDIVENVVAGLRKGKNKIVVERGSIIKIAKDKNGIVRRELLTKKWTDWVDYWAVDFNFESKREIVRIPTDDGKFEERWTGDYIFENEWQSFRTKKDRSIELKSVAHECAPGQRKIAVKVVDIFGNDTMKVIGVTI